MTTELTMTVDVDVEGTALRGRTLRLVEAVSDPGGAWVEVAANADLDPETLLDRDASIMARCVLPGEGRDDVVRLWTMRVARVAFLGELDGTLHYQLELRPVFWFLRFTRNVRKFRDEPAEAIVTRVLAESGVRFSWRTTRPCAPRPYCVQYRETNLDFVCRLLEFEGIHYFFEPDGTMVLADRSSAAAPVDGREVWQLLETGGALSHGDFGVTAFERGARVGSGKATVNDHDWKKPKTSLLASATGMRDTVREIYDYPVGYRDPAVGQLLAQLRLEALECEKRFVRGTSSIPTFAAGRTFELDHDEAIAFSGRSFLTRIEHNLKTAEASIEDAASAGGDGTPTAARYENVFQGIPAAVPWRPALRTPRPTVMGNHTAMVRGPAGEEIHTDVYGRAKVQFHWDREAKGDDDSRWIRTLQETGTSMALSRVGWEISVGYIDGDPDRPVGLARHINGQMIPTYGQPDNKRRMTIKSETYPGKAGYNELRLDDAAAAMTMDWHAQKDLRNSVENNRTEKIAVNSTTLIKTGADRRVVKNQTITVGANETRTLGADANVVVQTNRTHSVGGSETISVGKDHKVTVEGNDTETVGGMRRTFAGSVNADVVNPKALLASLVPKPEDVLGQVAGAALGDKVGGIATAALTGGDVGGAAMGALKSGAQAVVSPALNAAKGALTSGGGIGGAASAFGGALGIGGGGGAGGGAGGAAGGVVSAFQQGLALPSPAAAQAKLAAMFSPEAAVAKLKAMVSPAALLDKLFQGAIDRTTQKRFVRTVGGAEIELAGGSISHDAGKLLVEAVGGVKLTLAATEDIAESINGPLATTVGGLVMKKSKGDLSISSKASSVRIGAMAKFESDERIEIRGKTIEFEAASSIAFTAGDLSIELAPAKAKLAGSMKLDAETKLKVRGNPDKLTG